MSVIDEVLEANEIYARTHELRALTPRPERNLAVLTCMDTRLSIRTLGLKTGDAHIIRNAGGIVTDDTLRSLVISHYLLGTEEFMVINHTDCGLMHTTEQDLRTRIQNRAGTAVAPAFFYAFQNIEEKSPAALENSCAYTPKGQGLSPAGVHILEAAFVSLIPLLSKLLRAVTCRRQHTKRMQSSNSSGSIDAIPPHRPFKLGDGKGRVVTHFNFEGGFFGLRFLKSPVGIPLQHGTTCTTIPPL